MKTHTTQAGDQFLIDHIRSTTKWSQFNRRRNRRLRQFMKTLMLDLVIISTLLTITFYLCTICR